MSHESVPATGAVERRSMGQAALAAGLSLRTLIALTEELKGTPHDLRAPGPESPVRQDTARLSTWLQHSSWIHPTYARASKMNVTRGTSVHSRPDSRNNGATTRSLHRPGPMSEPTVLTFTLTYAATLGGAALMFLDQVIAFTAILALAGAAGLLTHGVKAITRRRPGS